MLRYFLILLICAFGLVALAQVERHKMYSLEATTGLASFEDFRVKSSFGFTAQVRVKPRFLLAINYERFVYRYVYERAADEYGSVSYRYDRSDLLGLYTGFDLVSRGRARLSFVAGPTVSGFYGIRNYDCGFDTCSKSKYSKLGRIGIGASLKGEFSFTKSIYGLAQLNGHESLENRWTRYGFRVGAGVRL